MQHTIDHIQALEILDSRGNPTVQVTVRLAGGLEATASVPSGASTGTFEAFELRDGDPKRYDGAGVQKAIANVNTSINKHLRGTAVGDQRRIDDLMIELDGTENKQKLGANAILGVSLAVARAAALAEHVPLYQYLRSLAGFMETKYTLPIPLINVINGGKHASSNLDLQEFWVVPQTAATFNERLRQGSEIFHALGMILKENSMDTDLGNEGGYAPNFSSHQHVFELIMQAITRADYTPGVQIGLGLDAGSSVFFDKDTAHYTLSLDHEEYSSDEFIEYYLRLMEEYPLMALEDPLAEEEWVAWQKFTKQLAERHPTARLIGDDLFVTNVARLQRGIDMGIANTVLIKPNQIGTLTETLECIMLAKKHSYDTVISHRSGETTDTFIADLCVAVNSKFIKTGSTARGERTAKYNRLLEIEQELYAT